MAAAVLLTLIAAGFVLKDPWLRYLVRREALAKGIELDFDSMEMGQGWIRLRGARIRLEGVRGLTATVQKARLSLDGGFPPDVTQVEAQAVVVQAQGSAADLALELAAWAQEHPDAFRLPLTATEVVTEWREQPSSTPWLQLSGGSMTPGPAGASTGAPSGATRTIIFHANGAVVSGVSVGPVGAVWAADATTISLGFGKETLAAAPIRIDIRSVPSPATVDIRVMPVTMADLGSPMGLALPTEKATIEGTVKLQLGKRPDKDAITGAVAMTLKGWIPPHPKELGGIVFGTTTAFASAFRIAENRSTVTLSDASVAAGAFKLKGGGLIERRGEYAVVTMDMKGAIPCADVARSAVASNFGSAAGVMAGQMARGALEGSVNVAVHIQADTRNLQGASVRNEVGVGCGLKLLPGVTLPIPTTLPTLPKLPDFPKPGELPKLPDIFGKDPQ